jgi:hypothetical protein
LAFNRLYLTLGGVVDASDAVIIMRIRLNKLYGDRSKWPAEDESVMVKLGQSYSTKVRAAMKAQRKEMLYKRVTQLDTLANAAPTVVSATEISAARKHVTALIAEDEPGLLSIIPESAGTYDYNIEGLENAIAELETDTFEQVEAYIARHLAGNQQQVAADTQDQAELLLDGPHYNTVLDQVRETIMGTVEPKHIPMLVSTVAAIPEVIRQLYDHPPGFTCNSGDCSGCGRPLEEVVSRNGRAAQVAMGEWHHVQTCVRQREYDNAAEAILTKYPPVLDQWPTEKVQKQADAGVYTGLKSVVNQPEGTISLYDITSRLSRVSNDCVFCDDHFENDSTFRAHLVENHSIHLPPGYNPNSPLVARYLAGEWSLECGVFPKPKYWLASGVIVVDPAEQESVARSVYEAVILKPALASKSYGRRKDLEYSKGDGGDAAKDAPADTKYRFEHHPRSMAALCDPFCILCANNPGLRWSTRMLVLPRKAEKQEKHVNSCLKDVVKIYRQHSAQIAKLDDQRATLAQLRSEGKAKKRKGECANGVLLDRH